MLLLRRIWVALAPLGATSAIGWGAVSLLDLEGDPAVAIVVVALLVGAWWAGAEAAAVTEPPRPLREVVDLKLVADVLIVVVALAGFAGAVVCLAVPLPWSPLAIAGVLAVTALLLLGLAELGRPRLRDDATGAPGRSGWAAVGARLARRRGSGRVDR